MRLECGQPVSRRNGASSPGGAGFGAAHGGNREDAAGPPAYRRPVAAGLRGGDMGRALREMKGDHHGESKQAA